MNLTESFQFLNFKKRIGTKSLVVFTQQLSTLIGAGLPLIKALRALHDQLEPCALKDVVAMLANEVESGANFSEALSHFPKVFPEFYVNMTKAGELGGMLDGILKRLSEFLDKNQKLRERIKSALMYPAFVLLTAVLILIMLMMFVIPTFTSMFSELGGALPLPTKILIATSDIIRKFWYLIPFIPVVLVLLYKFLIKSPGRRLVIDKIKLYIPIVGVLVQQVAVARFARTLGTLLSSGAPILSALQTVKNTVGNEFIGRAVLKVRDSIKEGETVSGPMETSKAFPPLVVKMINIGEETGQLDKMLIQIADNYEEEVDVAISGLTSLLEPLLIVFMGLVVGFIAISMFMPLFSLVKLIG
ncbi:MAG: type II secretion system F family protein [Candidatus Omnitrophica bacterium]|nr:type II secretion system F family protein [Candidatus Omnitrophota bacterium]MBU4457992.1 type II secretion system F family protein [Candidatus Omnitrophota bacterium]